MRRSTYHFHVCMVNMKPQQSLFLPVLIVLGGSGAQSKVPQGTEVLGAAEAETGRARESNGSPSGKSYSVCNSGPILRSSVQASESRRRQESSNQAGLQEQVNSFVYDLTKSDLIHDLKGELGGKFETLIVALMTPPITYDVTTLHHAIKGAGTDEKVLVEILASRTPQQVKDIIAAYKKEYDHDLEKDVCGDTSGHFQRLLVILLQANRQTGIQQENIQSDAETLFKAGEQKFGTDEQTFVTILGNRSAEHLRKVFDAYMKLSGYEMEESIKRETSGSLRDLLLAVVKCARSVPGYFAETLYYAMKGAGTDDATLIRVMVSRSEVDMLDIRAEFRRKFACSLYSMIKGDTSGDYRKTLLLLCGGDDA